jgi:hypothetical protein
MQLIAIGQISKIFAIDNGGLVGDNDASTGKSSFVHHQPEEFVQFGEVLGSEH